MIRLYAVYDMTMSYGPYDMDLCYGPYDMDYIIWTDSRPINFSA